MNDNRNYVYSADSFTRRDEYQIILSWITKGSRVIDLGCGDGTLLQLLQKREIEGEGIEISESGVREAREKGLTVTRGRIDTHLPYKKKEFDYSICNVTLQMVMYPEILITEMKRVSKMQIISFPNFGFILNRFELLFLGRMPKTMIPNYDWYSTGHIHQLSVNDFISYCTGMNLKIIKSHFLFPGRLSIIPTKLLNPFSPLMATEAIFLLEEKDL